MNQFSALLSAAIAFAGVIVSVANIWVAYVQKSKDVEIATRKARWWGAQGLLRLMDLRRGALASVLGMCQLVEDHTKLVMRRLSIVDLTFFVIFDGKQREGVADGAARHLGGSPFLAKCSRLPHPAAGAPST
jgi:hypothetical protein